MQLTWDILELHEKVRQLPLSFLANTPYNTKLRYTIEVYELN